MKSQNYLYTIHHLVYSPYYKADMQETCSIIDKCGNLGERALKNRALKQHNLTIERIERIECACYAN